MNTNTKSQEAKEHNNELCALTQIDDMVDRIQISDQAEPRPAQCVRVEAPRHMSAADVLFHLERIKGALLGGLWHDERPY